MYNQHVDGEVVIQGGLWMAPGLKSESVRQACVLSVVFKYDMGGLLPSYHRATLLKACVQLTNSMQGEGLV